MSHRVLVAAVQVAAFQVSVLAACLCAALAPLHAAASTAAQNNTLQLHRPSPDWRDQVLYFVLTDRFADGDPSNNDQGAGEFDPADRRRYSGGDLRGLTQRLDYIRGLGATGLWITPPVANQWWDPKTGYSGYHGYWARHFKQLDPHMGTLADYRQLSHELHRHDMVLVQDIVLNHTGNFFGYGSGWRADDPTADYQPNPGSTPTAAPTQAPFDLNDPRRAADRAAGTYHWTPNVADYGSRAQELNYQMSGLDDLNTENVVVRRALRDSYSYWIREVGVDAFRIDTAFYVPPELFVDFLHSRDPDAPGVAEVARRTGRNHFHVFGEGFGIDQPFQDEQARKVERYMTAPDGTPVLPGMLNFPLYGALGDVFARGRPPAELAHRIRQTMALHARPHLMPSFVDNHDVDRFLAGGSEAGLRQALLALFTLPGIPVVYYGTEQGATQQRASLFAGGWGSGGRDRFDTQAPLYRHIAELAKLRRDNRLFSRGQPTVLQAGAAEAGALAWRMDHEGQAALVVMNTADTPALLHPLDLGLAAGARLPPRFSSPGASQPLRVDAQGRVAALLPARASAVYLLDEVRPPSGVAGSDKQPRIDPLPADDVNGDFSASGTAPGAAAVRLVLDGRWMQAQRVSVGTNGRWQAQVQTVGLADTTGLHALVAVRADAAGDPTAMPSMNTELLASEPAQFRLTRRWQTLAEVADPAGDDHGPDGRTRYPTDPSWGDNRQMDLRRVSVATAGGALKLSLQMQRLTQLWSPANGFDHVAFTVYVELPGQAGGSRVMPLQNADLPAGMRWHRRLRVHGWSNALFSADGASSTNEGTPVAPAATLSVDRATHTLHLVLPAQAMGSPGDLRGARVYVTTWDYDGGYRALAPEAGPFTLGGGTADGPKVMDDCGPITLH
jgi:glycosidase